MRTCFAILAAAALVLFAPVPATAVFTEETPDAASGTLPASYTEALALIEAERFSEALPLLAAADAERPHNADVLNQFGFVSRKLGDFASARRYYDRALAIDPGHLGAREYRGELFVETGDLDAAKAELTELERRCGLTCEEYRDLAAALAAAGS